MGPRGLGPIGMLCRRAQRQFASVLMLALLLSSAASAAHSRRKPRGKAARATVYGSLSAGACLKELARRGIAFSQERKAAGVRIPVRLTGKVGGVLYRTDFPDRKRPRVAWEVFDCRLVLALDDFSGILREHDIEEARIFSAWRPDARLRKGSWGRRHAGALAVDIREFRKAGGTALVVEEHFHGRIGATVCGDQAEPPDPPSNEATELREIVCKAAEARIFNTLLTPNNDREHGNHFHLDVTPGVGWFIVR